MVLRIVTVRLSIPVLVNTLSSVRFGLVTTYAQGICLKRRKRGFPNLYFTLGINKLTQADNNLLQVFD
jgi:hypothetical protein